MSDRKDNRYFSEKILSRLSAYWTGFCIAWAYFAKPSPLTLFGIYLLVLFIIIGLDIMLYTIQRWKEINKDENE